MSFIKLFSGNHKNKIVCIWTSVGWGFVAYFASNWQRCPVGVVGEERSDWGIVFRKQLGVPLYQCSRTYHKLAGNERERPSMTQAILCSKVQLKKLSNTAYHNKLTNFHYCKINKAMCFPNLMQVALFPSEGVQCIELHVNIFNPWEYISSDPFASSLA